MSRELITRDIAEKVRRRVEELLVRSWKMSNPIFPKMKIDFRVHPIESYFSTVGQIWFLTPFWRGDKFTHSILLHEGYHWTIFPVDVFRSLEEIYKVRRLLAEEYYFTPKKIKASPWREEEDWTGFEYTIPEIQFVQNILGDYLVNLHIHERHPSLWTYMWNFLTTEGTFYEKAKALKRDTSFELYLAVYPHLVTGLEEYPLKTEDSKEKVPLIASYVRQVRDGRISTVFALKELVKLFHKHFKEDKQAKGRGKENEEIRCPKCGHNDWEIVAYEEGGKWKEISELRKEENES